MYWINKFEEKKMEYNDKIMFRILLYKIRRKKS